MILGNALSAFVGITSFHLLGGMRITLLLAEAFSIFGMFVLHWLHAPAATVALIAVLGHISHYRYAFS